MIADLLGSPALPLLIIITVGAIAGSLNALGYAPEVWALTGIRRERWIWQAVAAFLPPVAAVYTGIYFVRVQPRLNTAVRQLLPLGPGVLPEVSGDAAASPGSNSPYALPGQLTIRTSWTQTGGSMIVIILAVNVATFLTNDTRTSAGWQVRQLVVGAGIVFTLFALQRLVFQTRLTAEGIYRSARRRSFTPWSEVIAITDVGRSTNRHTQLWLRNGSVRTLRAPVSSFGSLTRPQFEADVATVRHWWWTWAAESPFRGGSSAVTGEDPPRNGR